MSADELRVLVVDDQALVRAGFAQLLSLADDIDVVGEASDGREAMAMAKRLVPDVVLMDIRMPGVDGIEATRRIVSDPTLRRTRVVMLTTFDADELVVEALQAGASGFLLKDVEPEDLRQAVRVVAAGDALLSPSATRKLLNEFASSLTRYDESLVAPLTDREREVATWVGRGLSNDEIADRLYLSVATVKTHANRAMTKLGVHDRAGLVIVAYEAGMVRPGET